MSLRLRLVLSLVGILLPRFAFTIGLAAITSASAILGGGDDAALSRPETSSWSRKNRRSSKSQGFDGPARHFVAGIRGGAGGSSNPYKARMQVMITRNMRKVLVGELGYLIDEVEDMDPQIAAVVIEKSLPRPRAGMPIVWRKSIRRQGVSQNPLTYFARALRGGVNTALQGVAVVAAFPFRVLGRLARTTKRRAAVTQVVVVVVTLAAVMAGVVASSQNDDPERTISGSVSSVGGGGRDRPKKGKKDGMRVGALWPIRGARAEHVRSTETPVSHRRPREGREIGVKASGGRSWVGRRRREMKTSAKPSAMASSSLGRSGGDARTPDDASSKPNPGMEYTHRSRAYNTHKTLPVNGRIKAQRGSRNSSSSNSHHRHSLFERVDSSERSFREPSPERDEDMEMDMNMEDVETWKVSDSAKKGMPVKDRISEDVVEEAEGEGTWFGFASEEGSGEDEGEEEVYADVMAGSDAEGALRFEDVSPQTTEALEEERGRDRWGRRPLSEHIPSEEELEAWESRLEASDSWLDRGINRLVGNLFGEGGNSDRH